MRKLFSVCLLLAIVLSLCACAGVGTTSDSAPQTTYGEPETQTTGETVSVPTATTVPQTTSKATEPTAPLHSQLYLPDHTLQQILEYFEEVALDMEYSNGPGDSSLVQKWTEPISYRVHGAPTEADLAVLNDLFAQLNEIPGFPGFYNAEDWLQEDLSISFLEPEAFAESFSDVINGEDAYGAAQFWYYTDTNKIHTARIGCRTDIDQSIRDSVLAEEIINALGISDTQLREDSIVYQYSDENTALSDVDWVILKLLYDPAIQCGMDADSCAGIIEKLYY